MFDCGSLVYFFVRVVRLNRRSIAFNAFFVFCSAFLIRITIAF